MHCHCYLAVVFISWGRGGDMPYARADQADCTQDFQDVSKSDDLP